jgi:serine/threonine protein kinase
MATVYRAYQSALEREVAIKVIAPAYTTNSSFIERFQREARATAKLHHPNILTIYDFGQDPNSGEYYIVSELIEGSTLRERLGQPFAPQEAARLLQQLADALDYAHEMGIIHRDVKPGNILLDKRGRAILGDFGIARLMEGASELTASGLGVGTPAYMSPEQAMGETVDGRCDQYSLGIVLYEMLTGKPPFQASTPVALVMAHATRPLPDPRQYNPALSEAVVQVLTRALAKDPAQRYPTTGQFAQAFRAALDSPASDRYFSNKSLATEVTPTIPISDSELNYFRPDNPPPSQNFTTPVPSHTTQPAVPGDWPAIKQPPSGEAERVPPDALPVTSPARWPSPSSAPAPSGTTQSPRRGGLLIGLGVVALVAIIGVTVTLTLLFSQGRTNPPVAGLASSATATPEPAQTLSGEQSPGGVSGASGSGSDCPASQATPVFTRLAASPGARQGQLNLQVLETACRAAKADAVSVKIYRQNDPNTEIANACCRNQFSFALAPGTYRGIITYANGIEQTLSAIEIKEGQTVFQNVNLQLGQAQLELLESSGKSARADSVSVKIFKAGDRNTPVTTACCNNKLTFYLKPGRYEWIAGYANGIELEGKPLEIKDGEVTTQTLNYGVGRLKLSLQETDGKSAKGDAVSVKVFKPGDYNTPITTACCGNQLELVLRPGQYEVIANYADGIQAPALPVEISESKLDTQTINYHVGQASLEIARANGQGLNGSEVSVKIYKLNDPETVITTGCCATKLNFSLLPGRYKVEVTAGNLTKTPVTQEIEIKEGQITTQTVKI